MIETWNQIFLYGYPIGTCNLYIHNLLFGYLLYYVYKIIGSFDIKLIDGTWYEYIMINITYIGYH